MKITAGTIGRTVVLVLALVNQLLMIFGRGTIDFVEEDVYQIVSTLFTVATAIVAWWKNNSFTKEARVGDMVMKEEKKYSGGLYDNWD